MRILGDMHTHSRYSIDGKDSIESMCLSAINNGLENRSAYDFDMIIGNIHWICDESIEQRELLETYL